MLSLYARVNPGNPLRDGVESRVVDGGCSFGAQGPKARFVYGVRHGRVRFVAVATRAASKNRTVLRGNLKRAEFL